MEENKIIYVPVGDILPNRFQPRLAFDEKELNELATSIVKYGVIQPIVLRKIGEKYEIIAGERRYKASILAGLKSIPSIIMNTDDNTSAEIALLENIQRKNLTVIEEAQSYKKLIDKGFTQDDIASKLGVSQSSIANKLRLLNLPKEVQNALLYNQISERHARSLLTLNNADLQNNLLKRIISEKLTVKQTEDEIATLLNKDKIENEEIPEDIMKFLKPEPKKEETIPAEQIENLDLKVPEIVEIKEEQNEPKIYEDNSEIINPFQTTDTAQNIDNIFSDTESIQTSDTELHPVSPKEENHPAESAQDLESNIINEQNYIESNSNTTIEEENNDSTQEEEENDGYVNEDGEVNLPNVLNDIRDYVSTFNYITNLISMSEVDLPDKYQIVIDINKNV